MKNKEVLLITNYFPPEKGAASNRLFSLVKGLSSNGYSIKVVCPLPNYPQGKIFAYYRGKVFSKKKEPYGTIYRLWLWPSSSGNKFVRVLSMISFSLSLTLYFLFNRIPKTVIIQYSPIFVGFTGVFWSRLFRKKIVLNVSDLWPLAGLEMGLLKKGFYFSLLTKMEHFCYRNSNLILGQSQEILSHIKKPGIKHPLFLYRNYPEFTPPNLLYNQKAESHIRIVYAGLLGVAQGLYKICSEINFSEKVSLHLFGNGPEIKKISLLKKKNVFYHGEIDREELHQKLQNHRLGFVPLTNRIYGSVPSKIFELSRLGLPILYFAGGEGEDIVRDNCLGWVVPVNDMKALQYFIDTLTPEKLKEFSKADVQNQAIKKFEFSHQLLQLITKLDDL